MGKARAALAWTALLALPSLPAKAEAVTNFYKARR
jgi:hypothetical protein